MKATLDDQGRQKQIFESEFLMSGLLLNIIWTFLLNLFILVYFRWSFPSNYMSHIIGPWKRNEFVGLEVYLDLV